VQRGVDHELHVGTAVEHRATLERVTAPTHALNEAIALVRRARVAHAVAARAAVVLAQQQREARAAQLARLHVDAANPALAALVHRKERLVVLKTGQQHSSEATTHQQPGDAIRNTSSTTTSIRRRGRE
jgi:hypothetical protein